jgi:hypothetical protein
MEGLVLTRLGHYCTPRMNEAYSCQTALVVHVKGTKTNLRVYDSDGDPFIRLDVEATVNPDPEKATFHLSQDCPFNR